MALEAGTRKKLMEIAFFLANEAYLLLVQQSEEYSGGAQVPPVPFEYDRQPDIYVRFATTLEGKKTL